MIRQPVTLKHWMHGATPFASSCESNIDPGTEEEERAIDNSLPSQTGWDETGVQCVHADSHQGWRPLEGELVRT